MSRCHICNKPCPGTIRTTEKRYFYGEQTICKDCFDHLVVDDYEYLDKKAIAKIGVKDG